MKKLVSIFLILCVLLSCVACGDKTEGISDNLSSQSEVTEPEPVEEPKDPNAGITLELEDGTIIRPGDDAYLLANCSGAVVRYNGEPTKDYAVDVNGIGVSTTLGGGRPGWCDCQTNDTGKLFLFVLDNCKYLLSIECNGEIAQFDVDAKNHFMYNIAMGGASIEPGKAGYIEGCGSQIVMPVYYKGELCKDYEVSISEPEYGSATKGNDGKLHFSAKTNAQTCLTITYNGESRSYRLSFNATKDNTKKNPFVDPKQIAPEKLGGYPKNIDISGELAGTTEQQNRLKLFAKTWKGLGKRNLSKGFSLSWDDALSLVGEDSKTLQDRIKTLGDCMLYFAASGFERLNGDLRYTSNDVEWHFNTSPEVTIAQNGGNCGAIASLICYLLDGDYEDVGIITMWTPHKEGHVINYVVHNGYSIGLDVSSYIINYNNLLVLTNCSDGNVAVVMKNSVPVYKHKMAIAYSGKDCINGDMPTGLVKGNTVYMPADYNAKIHSIIQDEKSGTVFESVQLSTEEATAISEKRNAK